MAVELQTDVPISIKEAMGFWGKSKKTVMYAIWKEKILARQSVYDESWHVSLNSCVSLWGEPIMSALVSDIRKEWNGN